MGGPGGCGGGGGRRRIKGLVINENAWSKRSFGCVLSPACCVEVNTGVSDVYCSNIAHPESRAERSYNSNTYLLAANTSLTRETLEISSSSSSGGRSAAKTRSSLNESRKSRRMLPPVWLVGGSNRPYTNRGNAKIKIVIYQ